MGDHDALVERLRLEHASDIEHEAADAIEALTAERDTLRQVVALFRHPEFNLDFGTDTNIHVFGETLTPTQADAVRKALETET